MGVLPDPKNVTSSVATRGNPLGNGLPSVASSTSLPAAPASGGKDPCSSTEYLKDKLKTMPILGNLSLSDLAPNINLEEVSAPKIPTVSEIGSGLSKGVSDAVSDMKDSVGKTLDGLKPSSLIPKLKAEAGALGREALAGALENAMMDALGPVKGGIGDRITRSVKQNLLMAGVSEVANIIAGEPNIFDPCAGKDKLKTNAAADASAGEVGRLNNDINKSITNESQKFASESNRNARDIIPPVKKPALPQIGNAPPLPAEDDSSYASAVQANEKATNQVTDSAVQDVAKKTAAKQAHNEERKDNETTAAAEGVTATGDHFSPVEAPDVKYHYINSEIFGPKSGWPATGSNNMDIIQTIESTLRDEFIPKLDTRSSADVPVGFGGGFLDLESFSKTLHSQSDVQSMWNDYIGDNSAPGKLNPRHYMIWVRTIATSNTENFFGAPRVTVNLLLKVYRTCDNCGLLDGWNHNGVTPIDHTQNYTGEAETPVDAYKAAVSGLFDSDEFQWWLTNNFTALSLRR
jgi:hypothetical protein